MLILFIYVTFAIACCRHELIPYRKLNMRGLLPFSEQEFCIRCMSFMKLESARRCTV